MEKITLRDIYWDKYGVGGMALAQENGQCFPLTHYVLSGYLVVLNRLRCSVVE